VDLYSAFIVGSHSRCSGLDHTVYLQIAPYLPLRHKRSPDGASTNWNGRRLIADYYSFIDPKRIKGWVGLVGWLIVDGLVGFTHISGHPSAAGRVWDRESLWIRDQVLSPCHATNLTKVVKKYLCKNTDNV